MVKEEDIRPASLFEEYIRLSALDAVKIFDMAASTHRACPGCGQMEPLPEFTKNGFPFVTCGVCGSLYADPLPPAEQFEVFYRDSEAARYWSEVFLPSVESARRTALLLPKVNRVHAMCAQAAIKPATILDVGAGHGAFLREFHKVEPGAKLMAVEPNAALAAQCRALGIETLEIAGQNAPRSWWGVADVVTCFEVLEHVPDPLAFVERICQMTRPGGLAIVTTLGCDGFDIRVLWERSNSISPPHHLNFCSRAGLSALFERAGFTSSAITTPGKLDVDIVRNALAKTQIPLGRFEDFLLSSDEATLAAFQTFLADNNLSSHHWIVARR